MTSAGLALAPPHVHWGHARLNYKLQNSQSFRGIIYNVIYMHIQNPDNGQNAIVRRVYRGITYKYKYFHPIYKLSLSEHTCSLIA